jgi:hypothetical protein
MTAFRKDSEFVKSEVSVPKEASRFPNGSTCITSKPLVTAEYSD